MESVVPKQAVQNPQIDPHFLSLVPQPQVNRRSFITGSVATGLAAGFALSAGPVQAQTAITTDSVGLKGMDFKVAVEGGQMPGYAAMPEKGGKRAVVIVVPEIFGMHRYQQDICRRLAKLGYFAVTFDPYFRKGDLAKMTDIKEVLPIANALEDKQMLADLDALVAWIEKQPGANAKKMGITGMCRGGRTTWMYSAHSKKIKAGVAWYGPLNANPPAMPLTPLDIADQLHAPVLGLYGGADPGIPVAMVERMRAALLAFGKDKESMIHVYEGMPHAFHADYRPSYRKEAAEDGWKRMLAWFKKHGVV